MSTSSVRLQTHDVPAGAGTLRVIEADGSGGASAPAPPPIVFLHGWPLSWRSWEPILHAAAAAGHRAIALDLPGIGASVSARTDGSKSAAVEVIREALATLGVERPVLVGHDLGGMIAYPYLRAHPDELAGVVLASIAIPGVEPWEAVRANPHIWHFAFHAIPDLPELVVTGHEAEYFGYFYGATGWNQDAVGPELRAAHVGAYADPAALAAGFDYYRAFPRDTEANASPEATGPLDVPLLYLRGDHEFGDLDAYARGFHGAGLTNVSTGLVTGAGHFTPEEAPEAFWALVRDFARARVG